VDNCGYERGAEMSTCEADLERIQIPLATERLSD